MLFIQLSLVVANCGASIAENCTYFESTGSEVGMYLYVINGTSKELE